MATLRMRGKWAEEQLLIRSDSGMVRDPRHRLRRQQIASLGKVVEDDYHPL